ncbi:hypothetical protein NDU88_002755 [Pleurodeles waltl]|uniref:Uncharacterized protein n=1 Tax=Pleurodeles waltl TaxID=8319 RepID=A0AAV7VFH3_PLEWA|nr:hypothetical protein NDU88_002755 [Pleurodeles waltl]
MAGAIGIPRPGPGAALGITLRWPWGPSTSRQQGPDEERNPTRHRGTVALRQWRSHCVLGTLLYEEQYRVRDSLHPAELRRCLGGSDETVDRVPGLTCLGATDAMRVAMVAPRPVHEEESGVIQERR